MFRNILNSMLNSVPGFMRPALNWLIGGIQGITNYVAQRWTSLGSIAGYWRAKVIYWGLRATDFLLTFVTFMTWLVLVFVPNWVGAKVAQAVSVVTALVAKTFALAQAGLAVLRQWAIKAVNDVLGLLAQLKTWAVRELNRLIAGFSALIRALAHVLHGPDALAAWLAAAMWKALARLVYAQRERIVLWFTRESVTFTRWLALQVEDIIVRWL